MTWIDMPHHHVTRFFFFFLVTDGKFFMACHYKNTCHDLISYILKISIAIIHVSYIILYMIHQCIYTLSTLMHTFIKV
jgi:hypothetical protein